MSQGRSGTSSPTKGGAMPQPSMQTPFGNQNYRLPSYENSPYMEPMPSFETSPYLQPMPSPGGKGGQQPMPSPGSKGGQSRQPISTQPYPMPSPGGKGGSYQRPPTPYGYGQPTFSPQQFAGYGQPSNIFSFNNPHYQPYNPYPIQPYTGNTGNPMINKPEVMGQNSTPITGNGGTGYSSELKVFDPYGPGGPLEGQPRPTFPDPTQPQGPMGGNDYANRMFDLLKGLQTNNSSIQSQGSGIAGLFNSGNLAQQMRSQIPGPPTGADSVFNNPRYKDLQMQQQRLSMAGRDRPEVKAQLQNLGDQLQNMMNNSNDAAYYRQLEQQQGQQRGGYNIAGQYDPNMPAGYGTSYQTLI